MGVSCFVPHISLFGGLGESGKKRRGNGIDGEEVVTSCCHESKISGSQETVLLQVRHEKKKRKKMACMTFLGVITLRDKTVAHIFVPSFDNATSRLFWKTWRHTSPLYKEGAKGKRKHVFVSYRKVTKPTSKEKEGRRGGGGQRSAKRTNPVM